MYTRDLNRVYALIISGERRKGGEEKEKKKKRTGGHASNGKAQFYYRYDEISDGGAWRIHGAPRIQN